MNIVEYRTVSAISSKELDNAVNRQLKLGFEPYGAPYVVGSGSTQSIFQALVKLAGAIAEEGAATASNPITNGFLAPAAAQPA
jgi:hypothetical protein